MTGNRTLRHGPFWAPEGVQFRLWAPSAQSVDLVLNGKTAPMQKAGDGWYALTSGEAKTGDLYSFRIDGKENVPDPASRFQPEGPNGASGLFDPKAFVWSDDAWRPMPWEDTVIYELHVGTFTHGGAYRDIENKLDYLVSTGITAIELMPLASFAGQRGWGYDGVMPYAPHAAYGTPHDLKHLIDAAHRAGLMVFLDVVYNHFGPSGNFLNDYAKDFFTDKYKTPWGSAVNMEGENAVRDFFIDNALYWLQDYHFDGLRFDAVHAIVDHSERHILIDLAEAVRRECPGKHLILENDNNEARYLAYDGLQPKYFTAQWNDDIHQSFHVLLTGETDSYYEDFKDRPLEHLGRCFAEGFSYQGQASLHRKGQPRGEKSAHLPPQAFVSFLQNHDQIGNRAMGERLASLASPEKCDLATTLLLLAPQTPLIFMGEEWGAKTPFLYFCDFDGDLADQVREGRRNEFKSSAAFADPKLRDQIPDPNAEETFRTSKIDWNEKDREISAAHLAFFKHLLRVRQQHVVPLLKSGWLKSSYTIKDNCVLEVLWVFKAGTLRCVANFSADHLGHILPPDKPHLWGAAGTALPAWCSAWIAEVPHD